MFVSIACCYVGKAGLRNKLKVISFMKKYMHIYCYYFLLLCMYLSMCKQKTWNIPNVPAYPIGLQNTFISLNLSIY